LFVTVLNQAALLNMIRRHYTSTKIVRLLTKRNFHIVVHMYSGA